MTDTQEEVGGIDEPSEPVEAPETDAPEAEETEADDAEEEGDDEEKEEAAA